MTLLHTEKFAGDTLSALKHGADYQIKINERDFGVYTSIDAGIKAARESITRELEKGNSE